MLNRASTFEFYYDSAVADPKEDPDEVRDRLATIAAEHGIECEFVDVADVDEEWADRRETILVSVRPEREYGVDNRVFTENTFGRLRPVLVVRYENEDGVDVYPHRTDDTDPLVRIRDFLDEVETGVSTDRGDYARLAEAADRSEQPQERPNTSGPEEEGWSASPASRRAVLAGLAGTGAVAGVVALVGLNNIPVVKGVLGCRPGPTEIGEILENGMVGATVEIRGTVDYSLDDEPGFTAFRLDGQTGTVPVYLANDPEREIEFGECLRIRGEVASGETRSADGPVVGRATVLNA